MLNSDGTKKEYIYKTDIQKFLRCSPEKATEIFERVKDYELELMAIEMFENRVPQDLFHKWRKQKRQNSERRI